jgi:lipoprotein-anchoring transpeptidase ErfK/SrfK
VCALVLLLFVGALAWADKSSSEKIAEGVTVGGVDVGGLEREAAIARLDQQIGTPSRRPVKVKVAGKSKRLSADDAGVQVDLEGAVDRAMAAGRKGNFIGRGWREITGGSVDAEQEAAISVDRKAVDKFVDGVAKDVNRPAVNAELSLEVTDVAVSPAKKGRKLDDPKVVEKRIVRAFRSPGSKRTIKAKVAVVKPSVSESDVWAKNPVIVTVAHDAQTVRVFKEGDVVKTYRVAVGADEFPTPRGRFAVDRKEKNPVWNVPDSDWAGSLAGTTVPGGDPRNPLVARWVGISGPVGFHGTKDLGSLGSRASHGCVRMNPTDVIDLYDRVEVGTPILIA